MSDSVLNDPYVDIDEQRSTTDPASGVTVSYRYMHGGFRGTTVEFSCCFPAPDEYLGRFFQWTYPTYLHADAPPATTVFAVAHGAYAVCTNNGGGGPTATPGVGGYLANAAAAQYSKVLAAEVYGADAPTRGYLYGGSGGAYQTLGGLANAHGVWAGGVPMVPGPPSAIPNFQTIQALALVRLGHRLGEIADAVEPGGSGDPSATLTDDERAVLEEVTGFGFPLGGWWQHADLFGGSFFAVYPAPRAIDPSYGDDFWTIEGYEGADPGSWVHAARLDYETTVVAVGADQRPEPSDDEPPPVFPESGTDALFLTLADTPSVSPAGADVTVLNGASAGARFCLGLAQADGATVHVAHHQDAAAVAAVQPGDRIRIDNSWFLAILHYHRHQVPNEDEAGWRMWRKSDGTPRLPQRPVLIGQLLAGGGFGVSGSSRYDGKMIMLAGALDVQAHPWAADWYRHRITSVTDGDIDVSYRLWVVDNADHCDPPTPAGFAHVVSYDGVCQQALLDLDAWVAQGVAPPATTVYRITDQAQVELAATAAERLGPQPTLLLAIDAADGPNTVEVSMGSPVALVATSWVPPGAGELVGIEWDMEGIGRFEPSQRLSGPSASTTLTHAYATPGTRFAVARVTLQRDGNPTRAFTRIQNLARVRIVVR